MILGRKGGGNSWHELEHVTILGRKGEDSWRQDHVTILSGRGEDL